MNACLAALKSQEGTSQASLHLSIKGASVRGVDSHTEPWHLVPLCFLPPGRFWTSFALHEKGAQVLRATEKSLGFQFSFNSDVSTEVLKKKPSSVGLCSGGGSWKGWPMEALSAVTPEFVVLILLSQRKGNPVWDKRIGESLGSRRTTQVITGCFWD